MDEFVEYTAVPTKALASAVADAARQLVRLESMLMEAPMTERELIDVGPVLDAARELVHEVTKGR